MRKLGSASIQSILKLACTVFLKDDSSPYFVSLSYKGHKVIVFFSWSKSKQLWYVPNFKVVYSNCVMEYFAGIDYNMCSGFCR